jgi:hypothetical protein
MKKLFFLISLFISIAASSQMKFLMPVINGTVSGPPPTGTTIRTEAEAFDTYSSITPINNLEADASLYDVIYSTVGGYGTYTITTAASGTHSISFRLISPGGAQFFIKDGSGTTLATVNVPNGNSNWQTVSTSVSLGSGSQTIKLVSNSTDLSFNWFEIDNSLPPSTVYYTYIVFKDVFEGAPSPWTSGISIWNNLNATTTQISTANGYTTNLHNDHLLSFGRTIVNTTAWTQAFNSPGPATNGDGVFDNLILDKGWKGPNGSRVKITGLDPARTYDFWVLANSQPYESTTVSFTISGNNSATTSSISTANNYGSSASHPDWKTDPALAKVTGIMPDASGNVIIQGNLVLGPFVPISVIVYKQN